MSLYRMTGPKPIQVQTSKIKKNPLPREKNNTYSFNIVLGSIKKISSLYPELDFSIQKYSHDPSVLLNDSCLLSFQKGICNISIITNPHVCESDLVETKIQSSKLTPEESKLIEFVKRHETGKDFHEFLKDVCNRIEMYLKKFDKGG